MVTRYISFEKKKKAYYLDFYTPLETKHQVLRSFGILSVGANDTKMK